MFYEPLRLDQGQRFLEVGLGSGYGTAIAREVMGDEGLVVAMDIDPLTFEFARVTPRESPVQPMQSELFCFLHGGAVFL